MLLAEHDGAFVGLVHYLYHRSTNRLEGTCYLQDLFTAEDDILNAIDFRSASQCLCA